MSKDIKVANNIINIDRARIKKLENEGNYWKLFEEFDLLRLKYYHEQGFQTSKEALRFMTLLRYMTKNGHNEATKYMAIKLLENIMRIADGRI